MRRLEGASILAVFLVISWAVVGQDLGAEEALLAAAHDGELTMVQRLLGSEVSPDARDEEGYTALMFAAGNGHLEVVEALIAAGADPNLTNEGHATALIQTVIGAGELDDPERLPIFTEIVRRLIHAGARVNFVDLEGDTALGNAKAYGLKEIVTVLEAAGGRL